jgi:hypothetical protein
MKRNRPTNESKEKLIENFLNEFPIIGEHVYPKNKYFPSYSRKDGGKDEEFSNYRSIKVKEIDDNGNIKGNEDRCDNIEVKRGDYTRSTYDIGANPFHKGRTVRESNFTLESIINMLGLQDGSHKDKYFLEETGGIGITTCNWNPFVYIDEGDDGIIKYYYQRHFCWDLEDKQLLIESIYNGINCGKVLIRKRSWEWVESMVKKGKWIDASWYDIVDGKQRLYTIHEFIHDKFPDKHGNYYSNLSSRAQHNILDNQLLTMGSFDEDASDLDIIETFIRLNIFGKVVEKSHMNNIQKIKEKLLKK